MLWWDRAWGDRYVRSVLPQGARSCPAGARSFCSHFCLINMLKRNQHQTWCSVCRVKRNQQQTVLLSLTSNGSVICEQSIRNYCSTVTSIIWSAVNISCTVTCIHWSAVNISCTALKKINRSRLSLLGNWVN